MMFWTTPPHLYLINDLANELWLFAYLVASGSLLTTYWDLSNPMKSLQGVEEIIEL